MSMTVRPIGTVKSVFHFKNGTPRQSSICDSARGVITIEKSIFNNPEHSLMGLEEFSHAWIIFIFHKSSEHTKAKVKPPRLNGQKVGVFSTRSPYRPNNIGLSLVKIDKIEGASVHISGIDILDGTPVIDIKPYIPEYDKPKREHPQLQTDSTSLNDSKDIDIFNHSPEYYKDAGMPSGITENSHDSGCSKSDGICSNEKEKNYSKNRTVLSSGCKHNNNILLTDSHRDQETIRKCDGCETLQEPKNTLFTEPDSFLCCDLKKNCDPISEGFYALSSALERAGEKLGKVANQSKQPLREYSEKQHEFNFPADDDDLCYNLLIDLMNSDVNNLDDKLHCKAGAQQHNDSDEPSHSVLNLPQKITTSEQNVLPMADLSTSDNSVESKTNNLEEMPSVSDNTIKDYKEQANIASWLLNPPVAKLNVTFTSQALEQLQRFSTQSLDTSYRFQMLSSPEEAQKSISDILQEDPRSVYRRHQFQDNLYYFALDVLHVTCWFDGNTAQVVRIKPVTLVPELQLSK